MALRLSQFLHPAGIALSLRSTDRAGALVESAQLLSGHPDVTSFDGFLAELHARDRLDTTNLGNGVALPHARTEHVRKIVAVVGRSMAGIPYEDNPPPVRLLFVLGTPKASPGDYLAVVSCLCRLVKDAAHRDALLAAATPEEFIATVVALEDKILGPVK